MEEFELHESACDMVANSIDEHTDKHGAGVTLFQLKDMIDNALRVMYFTR